MRNRFGVELKKGYYAFANGPRGAAVEGKIVSIDIKSSIAKAYGPQIKLESGQTVGADDVAQVLPPMRITKGGVVKANPLVRIKRSEIETKPSQATGQKPSPRLVKRRKKTDDIAKPKVWANPLVRVTVAGDSQRERKGVSGKTKSPSRRLMARRRVTETAPKGFYANPAPLKIRVEYKKGNAWFLLARFGDDKNAKQYARAWSVLNPTKTVRVMA